MNIENIINSYDEIDEKSSILTECVYKAIRKPFKGDEDDLLEIVSYQVFKCLKIHYTEIEEVNSIILDELYGNDDFLELYNRFDESRDNDEPLYIQNQILKETIEVIINHLLEGLYELA